MLKGLFRKFSEGPFKFMKKIEKPIIEAREKITQGYPFKSSTPIIKTLINSSIVVFFLW